MKVCNNSQKVFLYTNSRKVSNIYHYVFHMNEEVEYDLLVNAVYRIIPYFVSLQIAIYKDAKEFYYEHNDRALPVFSEINEDFVLIRDTNGYPFSVRCQDKNIRIDMAHAAMDGFASQIFAQYVLGNYIYLKYGECIDPAYIEEKSEDAILRAVADISDSPLLKQTFDCTDEKPGFEPDLDISKKCKRFILTFDEEELNQHALQNDVKSYSVLMSLFLRTFESMFSDSMSELETDSELRTFSVGFPVNVRRRLSLDESLHNCSSELIIPFLLPGNSNACEYEQYVQTTINSRLRSDLTLFNLQKCFKFLDYLTEEDCSLSVKQKIYRKGIAPRIFHFSHTRKFPNGEKFLKYMSDMENWVPVLDYPLYSVTVRYNGKVKLYITHSYDEKKLLAVLKETLGQSGLKYKIEVFEPCQDGAIEYLSM